MLEPVFDIIIHMDNQPISVYYETKFPYYILTGVLVVGFFIGFISFGGNYLMNPYFFLLCISIFGFLFVCVYQGSIFYIYEDKIIWKNGFHKIESQWDEFVGIHYDYAPNMWYAKRGFKSNNFFLEMKPGLFTKYADEWSIRCQRQFTFMSKAKDLIDEIKQRSGKSEDVGTVSAFKQRQNLWGIILLVVAIIAIGLGGLWYNNYQFQQEFPNILQNNP
jgi:hypothetical protein